MKRFLTNILVLTLLICLVMAAIVAFHFLVVGDQYTQVYTGSILDKTARMEAIHEPKIILVGNSNLSFGMDSARIEEALGMPVVNLGLHGGLGNAFHEELAKPCIREGDIVVICPTDYANDEISDTTLAWVTLETHVELWDVIRLKDAPRFFRAYPEYFMNAFKKWLAHSDVPVYDSSYARVAFNEYGDIVFRPDQDTTRYEFYPGSIPFPLIGDACLTRMNRFDEYVRSCGAQLVFTYAPVAMGEFTPEASRYLDLQAQLEQKLNFPIISDIQDYFIPYEYFYDSIFHLTDEGVSIRTNQLIADLLAWQETATEVSK